MYNILIIHEASLLILISSCKKLSNSDVPTFCEDIFKNNTLYHYQSNLSDLSYLLNMTSLQIQSSCLNLMRRYLCYAYHPVCDMETGDVVQFCNNSCEQLNNDPVCSDLILNMTRELELVDQSLPDIECLTAGMNSEADSPCLDIVNGKIESPYHCIDMNSPYTLLLSD